jgi:pyruvate/2-oxoglutarate dehydrogenase complex dihydrolipoamide acyltransferase (E2) component
MAALVIFAVLVSASAPPSSIPAPAQYVTPSAPPIYQSGYFWLALVLVVLAALAILLFLYRRRKKEPTPEAWSPGPGAPPEGEAAAPLAGVGPDLLPEEEPPVSEDALATPIPPRPTPQPSPSAETPPPTPAPKPTAPEEPSIDDVMKELDQLENKMSSPGGRAAAKKPKP